MARIGDRDRQRLRGISTFPSLVKYLRDELDWPVESDNFEDLTFEYEPEELGLDANTAAKIEEIKQLRPLSDGQPWGIFFVKFEPKRLPVVALRRVLSKLVIRKRAAPSQSERAAWKQDDLLFISAYGAADKRQITFAHFAESPEMGDLPTLHVLGWDDADTVLHVEHAEHELHEKLRWPSDEGNADAWRGTWRSAFTLRHRGVITTSRELAVQLAELARRTRKRVNAVLNVESDKGPLRKLMTAFREALIHDLKDDDFADMYAQTIAYGLLTARVSRPMALVADNLADMVPVTNPFLKELLETFLRVGGRKSHIDFDELGINDVVELLRDPDTDMEAILRDFGDRNRQEDPVIHFYELFLKEYDPQKRLKRGVFYTPRPVVSFIVRSVHEILKTEFGLEDGLADTTTWGEMAERYDSLKIPNGTDPGTPFVQILDPATGTGTFLVEVIDVIRETMKDRWLAEGHLELEFGTLWNEYVPKHLLPRLYGFELLMAPYAIAHMKIGLKLCGTGYQFGAIERARIYLTNTLEEPEHASGYLARMAPSLAREANAASDVKKTVAATVVIGNPPYAGISANMNDWIDGLLKGRAPSGREVDDYYAVNGEPLGEKKLWLQDDYVKFVRVSQWFIRRAGVGVHGMITNHTFLDSPTCRGMRNSLAGCYSLACLLDLHGSTKRQETPPEGTKDENVFDILPGVAISLLSRSPDGDGTNIVSVYDLWADRRSKNEFLSRNTVASVAWEEASLAPPYYLFKARDLGLADEYLSQPSLKELFPTYGTGVQTSRDSFAVDFDRKALLGRLARLFDKRQSDKDLRGAYKLRDTRGWKLKAIRRTASKLKVSGAVTPFLFRAFDTRWVSLCKEVVDWPREEIAACMAPEGSLGLLCSRQQSTIGFRHALAIDRHADMFCISNKSREGQTVFPLYLAPGARPLASGGSTREVNIKESVRSQFAARLGMPPRPEDMFRYVYSLLWSPSYRRRYAEFLMMDFPRVPLTANLRLFHDLTSLGSELVALHLMQSAKLDGVITTYTGPRNPEVARIGWSEDTVWLDAAATKRGRAVKPGSIGFRGVQEEVWDFHIGGYQVCEKWLKDRRGRRLLKDDILQYQKIVVTLSETIRLMAEIDKVIDAHGGWPGAFVTGKPATTDKSVGRSAAKAAPKPKPARAKAGKAKKKRKKPK